MAQRIPDTDFGIFPLYGDFTGNSGTLTEAEALVQIQQLKEQIGENNGNFKVGFGGIFSTKAMLTRNCRLLRDNNLSHVIIIGFQTHAIPAVIKTIANNDLRNYQWRQDGTSYNGVAGGEGRDVDVVTPSRYATTLRNQFRTIVMDKASQIKEVMDMYPGVIVSVNACIEEGLADATVESSMGDYSPYAVTEFRDWLRHTGMYDASTGTYKDEGASTVIVGNLISINGKQRSQFYDDPTPNNSNGTGISFNAKFGTNFTTWSLKYWDLILFPNEISNTDVDITPSGIGYTAGGFEAPRVRNTGNAFWNAWSYDVGDHAENYPAGNPDNPAFGFRQVMIHNFVNDILSFINETGIPGDMITAHQIPGEMLNSTTRRRNIASPIWTGTSKMSGSVGITRYGTISASQMQKITQYSNNWGIYEWHPQKSPTDNVVLKNLTMAEVEKAYNANCRIICPFKWVEGDGGLIPGGTSLAALYPVKGCGVAEGLKEWLNIKIAETLNNPPVVTFINPDTDRLTLTRGYDLQIEVAINDKENNFSYATLYIDGNLIRNEINPPYEWGHDGSPVPNELNGLNVGLHEIKVVTTDTKGAQSSAGLILDVRQPEGPYTGIPILIPGIVEAEYFDHGANGVSYYDIEIANLGGYLRPDDGVDIQTCGTDCYLIDWTRDGEWTDYTVNVQKNGLYRINTLYATPNTGTSAKIITTEFETNVLQFISTGSWNQWNTNSTYVWLNKGIQKIRLFVISGKFNIDKLEFEIANDMYGNGTGLTARYYSGMQFETEVFQRIDSQISFNWNTSSPSTEVPENQFSVKWQGEIETITEGLYTFFINSDNGRRLWINNELIIDKWINDWDIEYSGVIQLEANTKYVISIEYFENNGGADIDFSWKPPYMPKMIVPQSQLYPLIAQSIELEAGWNLISFYVTPLKTDTKQDISNLFPNAKIAKTNNRYFRRDQAVFLNTLSEIDAGVGYLIFNDINEKITMYGLMLRDEMIKNTLQKGWNLAGCPYSIPTAIETVFGTDIQHILIIKNFDGFWEPDGILNSINTIEPGKAYFIKK